MTSKKLNILFLPAWYPNRSDAMFGLFVKNHALSILPHCNVSVIYVQACNNNKETYEIEINDNEGIYEIIIYFRKSNIPFLGALINSYRTLFSYKRAWKLLIEKRYKPDINHVHILTRAGVIAFILNLFYKIPYVITEHWSRYYSFNNTYKGFLRKLITKNVVKKAAAMSTVSNSLKKAMNDAGLQNDNWSIIPNSIDTSLFIPSKAELKSDTIRIFHISCFEDKSKNVSGIIRAFATAIESNNNMELVMVGIGQDYNKAINLTEELHLKDKVEFTGELSPKEVIQKIDTCNFQVLFSNYETFSIVIAESLSAGKPVIATNAGAIPEVLPKEYGIFVEPKDEEGLSEAILKMAKTHSNYNSDAMRRYAINNYDKIKVGNLILEFYSEAQNRINSN